MHCPGNDRHVSLTAHIGQVLVSIVTHAAANIAIGRKLEVEPGLSIGIPRFDLDKWSRSRSCIFSL